MCLGMWFSGSCLIGDVDFGTSFAWGFPWGGFSWVCETGVFGLFNPCLRLGVRNKHTMLLRSKYHEFDGLRQGRDKSLRFSKCVFLAFLLFFLFLFRHHFYPHKHTHHNCNRVPPLRLSIFIPNPDVNKPIKYNPLKTQK